MDVVQTLDGGRGRSTYDPDEIEDEQRERERRNKINAGAHDNFKTLSPYCPCAKLTQGCTANSTNNSKPHAVGWHINCWCVPQDVGPAAPRQTLHSI